MPLTGPIYGNPVELERRTIMKKSLLVAITMLATLSVANAATITPAVCNKETIPCVIISGTIAKQDAEKFKAFAFPSGQFFVYLQSDGGDLQSGLEIAKVISDKHLETVVADGATCASVCGIIWLAGSTRWIWSSARVGFHSARYS